jgi:nucleotidyltransferase/DNA polymerase involved in DNA repair
MLGVGSATAKRLADFGVVTMTDLQQCPLEDLRRELGDNMSVTIKQLSQGIDDSPVTPYSKPQVQTSFSRNLRDELTPFKWE